MGSRARSAGSRHPPPGSSNGKRSVPHPTLDCNNCCKPLATTFFLCACDCIFCEECTYAHFEQSSQCPTCGRTLSENDFTELVVADKSTNSEFCEKKQVLQTFFTKKSSTVSLPISDLCSSFIRQLDMTKITARFLLKQFMAGARTAKQKRVQDYQICEALKQENTQIKQTASSERLKHEQIVSELTNRMQALEKTLQSKEKMIAQLQNMVSGGNPGGSHGNTQNRHSPPTPNQPQQEPPLHGFMKQKEANQRAQQEAYQQSQNRAPNLARRGGGPSAPNSSQSHGGTGLLHGRGGLSSSSSSNNYASGRYQQPGITPMQQQPQRRPFSESNSVGSTSSNPIRDLSASAGYAFSMRPAQQQQQQQNHHINKRRRVSRSGGTPSSSSNNVLSPAAAFAFNSQGQYGHHGGSPRQHSYHRR